LFKHYEAGNCLNALSYTSRCADPGKRGVAFDDVFRELLPLGQWNIKDLVDEHNTAGFPSGLVECFLGSCVSKEATETVSEGTIDLNGVALMKREKDEYDVKISDFRY
jgi:hypothetical protein